MSMTDWVGRLEAFLQFNEYAVLKDAEKISHEIARQLAHGEDEKFRIVQDLNYLSDFDREVSNFVAGKLPVEDKTKTRD